MAKSDKPYILLDTMVVAGIFALTKKGDSTERNKREWKRAVSKLREGIEYQGITVSPSVCFELMCWNKDWFEFVATNSKKIPLFNYSNEPIKNDILQIAAKYSYKCGENYSGCAADDNFKLKSMDPITAAYSIKHNHYILTENQRDFPESYFQLVAVEQLILFAKNDKKYRRFLCLIKPKNSCLFL